MTATQPKLVSIERGVPAPPTITIEKGVPAPQKGPTGTFAGKYPWLAMEVGDSFFAAGKDSTGLRSAARHIKHTHGFEFTAKNEPGGARIWRTA